MMRLIVNCTAKLGFVLTALSAVCWGQSAPSATQSELDYSARYSQIVRFGGEGGTLLMVTPSGDLHLVNGSERIPFQMQTSAGYSKSLSDTSGWAGPFVHTDLQGGVVRRHWSFNANGDVSYRAQFGTTGFSGTPGSGEPIAGNPTAGDSILMPNVYALQYNASGLGEINLTKASRVNAGLNTLRLRYPDGNGLESNENDTSVQFTHRVNARNNLSFQYIHTTFSYPSFAGLVITAKGVTVGYDRIWTRRLSTKTSAGPEFVRSTLPFLVPASTSFVASASLKYLLHSGQVSLSYERTTTAGSGYFSGAFVNNAAGAYSFEIGRTLSCEMTGGYRQNTTLGAMNSSIESQSGAVQVTRHVGRHTSFFANYTVMNQSSTLPATPAILTELIHSVSVGTEFSHRAFSARH